MLRIAHFLCYSFGLKFASVLFFMLFSSLIEWDLLEVHLKSVQFREGVKKNNYFFSSLLLLRGPVTPPSPLSSPVDNLDFRSIF